MSTDPSAFLSFGFWLWSPVNGNQGHQSTGISNSVQTINRGQSIGLIVFSQAENQSTTVDTITIDSFVVRLSTIRIFI